MAANSESYAAQCAGYGCGYRCPYCQADNPEAIRNSAAHAMSEQHYAQAGGQMSYEEKNPQRVVRQQADIPGIVNQPDRRA